MNTTEDKITAFIEKNKSYKIYFIEDFRDLGSRSAVKVALHRLTNKGILHRVCRGFYSIPKYSTLLDTEIHPNTENIVQAIVKRDKARIIPTAVTALNKLGLSTQVPLNRVYLTNGSPRTLTFKNTTVKLKRTSPRNLSYKSDISLLVALALKEIGKEQITDDVVKIVIKHLKKVDYKELKHDILNAPLWIAEIMGKALLERK